MVNTGTVRTPSSTRRAAHTAATRCCGLQRCMGESGWRREVADRSSGFPRRVPFTTVAARVMGAWFSPLSLALRRRAARVRIGVRARCVACASSASHAVCSTGPRLRVVCTISSKASAAERSMKEVSTTTDRGLDAEPEADAADASATCCALAGGRAVALARRVDGCVARTPPPLPRVATAGAGSQASAVAARGARARGRCCWRPRCCRCGAPPSPPRRRA